MTQNNGSTISPTNLKCAEEYTVRRGDSFYLISHKLGVPLRDLLAANRDIHPARLMVGDVLCIPREEDDAPTENGSTGSAGSTGTTGTPSPPSSVSGITGSTGSTGSAPPPSNVSGATGSTGSTGSTGTPPPPSNGAGSTGTTGPACPVEDQLTVQSGQTVADIQLRNLVSRNTLRTANPTVDLDQLTAGQVLCVPKENIPCPIPSTYTLAEGETLESVAIRYNLPVAAILRANPCLAPQDFEEGVTVILPK